MNDASTTMPHTAGAPQDPGHGKHRGPVSSQDNGPAPSGRHRRPVEEKTEVAA
ncbi:hypothetical protein [Streptomyces sp. NPDC046985]|uniref:hypothetical protein n=1 Tax=Streptomyces sp. NPDC046985 TaxID=3155377 RepID=UPI0033DEF227